MKGPRNVNRRLGDRLWDDNGHEWIRTRTSGYFLTPAQLQAASNISPAPRVALLADHAPLQWLAPARATAVFTEADTSFPASGNDWAATLWRRTSGGDGYLLLLEEVH